jgi:hypothetical protein
MQEAAARHAPLTVITVHQVAASGWIVAPIFLPVDEPTAEHARQAAEEAVAKAAAQRGESQPVSVTVRAVTGFPAKELIEASRDADLMVGGLPGRRWIRAADAGLGQRPSDAPRTLPCRRRARTKVGPRQDPGGIEKEGRSLESRFLAGIQRRSDLNEH